VETLDLMLRIDACYETRRWSLDHPDLEEAWYSCPECSWLIHILGYVDYDMVACGRVMLACVEHTTLEMSKHSTAGVQAMQPLLRAYADWLNTGAKEGVIRALEELSKNMAHLEPAVELEPLHVRMYLRDSLTQRDYYPYIYAVHWCRDSLSRCRSGSNTENSREYYLAYCDANKELSDIIRSLVPLQSVLDLIK